MMKPHRRRRPSNAEDKVMQFSVCKELLMLIADPPSPIDASLELHETISLMSDASADIDKVSMRTMFYAGSLGKFDACHRAEYFSSSSDEGGSLADLLDVAVQRAEDHAKFNPITLSSPKALKVFVGDGDGDGGVRGAAAMTWEEEYAARPSQVHFCTVGDLPPHVPPTTNEHFFSPPISGVCTPEVCSGEILQDIFNVTDAGESQFARDLLEVSSARVSTYVDESHELTRYLYLHKLGRSMTLTNVGTICEDDGLDFSSESYQIGRTAVVFLVLVLSTLVLVGTMHQWLKKKKFWSRRKRHPTIVDAGKAGVESEEERCCCEATNGDWEAVLQSFDACKNFSDCIRLRFHRKKQSSAPSTTLPNAMTDAHPVDKDIIPIPLNGMALNSDVSGGSGESIPLCEKSSLLGKKDAARQLYSPAAASSSSTSPPAAVASMAANNTNCLNGFRSLSMMWIIIGHTIVVHMSIGFTNPSEVWPPSSMRHALFLQLLDSARLAVDIFFLISGYLSMMGLLKVLRSLREKASQTEGKVRMMSRLWIFPFLLHRLLRILPVYSFVLLLWWKVAPTVGDGPLWNSRWTQMVSNCNEYAWTNLLFVNNLIPIYAPLGETNQCMYHTWYLAVDFQLFAVCTPLFASLYMRNRSAAKWLEAVAIAGISVTAFCCSIMNNWSSHMLDGIPHMEYDRDFYVKPWFRATPYLMGFLLAQIRHEELSGTSLQKRLFNWSKWRLSLLSWFLVIMMVVLTLWGASAFIHRPCTIYEDIFLSHCGSGWSTVYRAAYIACIKPVWGAVFATIMYLSMHGELRHGISRVLNWPLWAPMSKLTYCAYLLHPLVINVWMLGMKTKSQFSYLDSAITFGGMVVMTYIFALLVAIVVELPFQHLSRRLEKCLWTKR